MFKKANRLTKTEFAKFFNSGTKKHFPHLTVITHPNEMVQVAVVVGKKVAKTAVRRNTLKRRAYASLRKLHKPEDQLGVIIVILKPSYNSLTRKAAEELLEKSVAQVIKSA